ncbi:MULTISPECIES: NAD(P)-dependent oxidoreductase [Streptomyces]|uniref:NAD(P)-dependent oxidoreductase n=1 Tax=Streptomyces tsukubensis (strain DSM 42081 / NBRC 108919 / NRRL 18488 / 9993) TaxID=1114943 RepID=I2N431_STRT9|nr:MULTISPECIES: NAD(P)-binding domain-containing protein [Streptomyces]AZK95840.1 hydroxyacid dehydrogenase [Streptomyces tsukubensis]EIF91778.1 beta-hydroxyacid dehydrogenase, 3-hydroxyisobutyrate dehydrogenase [Streptomyces tsukubensis NRRL18488]MYS67567.1 NAD(P)-binding domain-containing protein [Streptomyces sp. SID5473]QKM68138.1 NAD(P)-dependent oxidoreductase [Streptomyces tsukubensis NRRL18488]TAI44540.1 NAD(P)-dependent oxidoreductase [Streptomyces tsukubensis]
MPVTPAATPVTPVTVVGLGSMGSALAAAFLAAGHPVTVWNRSPAKAGPLVEQGAVHEPDIAAAVAASPLVVACLSRYDTTRAALAPAGGALRGRTLATLNSGSPEGARAMAEWARSLGARFLDGAVKNVPQAVGAPDTQLVYAGDRSVFEEYEPVLRVLGGDTIHLGEESDLAALYEVAVGATLLPALIGFFHGAALVTDRGRTAASMVPYSVKWLEMIASILPALADEIDSGDYARPFSSIGVFRDGMDDDLATARTAGLDGDWLDSLYGVVRRAVAEGREGQSVSALTEVLRRPGS